MVSEQLNSAEIQLVKYSGEIVVGSLTRQQYLDNPLFTSEVRNYLHRFRRLWTSAVGVLGASFYDIAKIEYDAGSSKQRQPVKEASSNFVLLTELVDNVVDGRLFGLQQKSGFLDEMLDILFTDYKPKMPNDDVSLAATYQLARYIRQAVVEGDGEKRLERICRRLVQDSKAQFSALDDESALRILKSIGQGTTATSAVMSEIFDGRAYNSMMIAAENLGEYFEIRDAFADIDEDLKEGTPTYFTRRYKERLQQNKGDEKETKRELKKELLRLIGDSFAQGISTLQKRKSREMYRAMKLLIDIKYRLSE